MRQAGCCRWRDRRTRGVRAARRRCWAARYAGASHAAAAAEAARYASSPAGGHTPLCCCREPPAPRYCFTPTMLRCENIMRRWREAAAIRDDSSPGEMPARTAKDIRAPPAAARCRRYCSRRPSVPSNTPPRGAPRQQHDDSASNASSSYCLRCRQRRASRRRAALRCRATE